MAELIDPKDETINKLLKEKDILLDLYNIALCGYKSIYVIEFRVSYGDNSEYLDYDEIKKKHSSFLFPKHIYNFKEYSNLPETGQLFTTKNIVHDGQFTHIYGYLDEDTKTFVKFDYKYINLCTLMKN